MRSNLLYRRNPLARPTGIKPGFDPSHPAAQGISGGYGISVVAANGNLIDLTTGRTGTVSGAPTTSIKSHLGLGMKMSGGNVGFDFSGKLATAPLSQTLAAIIQLDQITGADQGIIESSSDLNSAAFLVRASGVLDIYTGIGGHLPSTITMTANEPFFVAVSFAPGIANFIRASLATGQILFNSVAGTTTPNVSNGTYRIGSYDLASASLSGTMAAAMFAPTYLTVPQLVQWAQAPWEFWYPRSAEMLVAATTVTPTTVLYQLMNVG